MLRQRNQVLGDQKKIIEDPNSLVISRSPFQFDIERVKNVRKYLSDNMKSPFGLLIQIAENGPLNHVISFIPPYDLFSSVIFVCRTFHDLTFFLLNSRNPMLHLRNESTLELISGASKEFHGKYLCESLFMKLATLLELKSIPTITRGKIRKKTNILSYAINRGFLKVVEHIVPKLKDIADAGDLNFINEFHYEAFEIHKNTRRANLEETYRRKEILCMIIREFQYIQHFDIPDVLPLFELLDVGIARDAMLKYSSQVKKEIEEGKKLNMDGGNNYWSGRNKTRRRSSNSLIKKVLSTACWTEAKDQSKRDLFDMIVVEMFSDSEHPYRYRIFMDDLYSREDIFRVCSEETLIHVIKSSYCSYKDRCRYYGYGGVKEAVMNKKWDLLEFILNEHLKPQEVFVLGKKEEKEEEEEEEEEEKGNKRKRKYFPISPTVEMFPYIAKKYLESGENKSLELIKKYVNLITKDIMSFSRGVKKSYLSCSINLLPEDTSIEFVEAILKNESIMKNPLITFQAFETDLRWVTDPLIKEKKKKEEGSMTTTQENDDIHDSKKIEHALKFLKMLFPLTTEEYQISQFFRTLLTFPRFFTPIREIVLKNYPYERVALCLLNNVWYSKRNNNNNDNNNNNNNTPLDLFKDAFRNYPDLHKFTSKVLNEAVRKCPEITHFLLIEFVNSDYCSLVLEEKKNLVTIEHFKTARSCSINSLGPLLDYTIIQNSDNNNNNSKFKNKSEIFGCCISSRNGEVIRKCLDFCDDLNLCESIGDFTLKIFIREFEFVSRVFPKRRMNKIFENIMKLYKPDSYMSFRECILSSIENYSVRTFKFLIHLPHWSDSYLLTLCDGYNRKFSFIEENLNSLFDSSKDEEEERRKKSLFCKMKCECGEIEICLLKENEVGKDFFLCYLCSQPRHIYDPKASSDSEKYPKVPVKIFCKDCIFNADGGFGERQFGYFAQQLHKICRECHSTRK